MMNDLKNYACHIRITDRGRVRYVCAISASDQSSRGRDVLSSDEPANRR